jgi:hypothetical protein
MEGMTLPNWQLWVISFADESSIMVSVCESQDCPPTELWEKGPWRKERLEMPSASQALNQKNEVVSNAIFPGNANLPIGILCFFADNQPELGLPSLVEFTHPRTHTDTPEFKALLQNLRADHSR